MLPSTITSSVMRAVLTVMVVISGCSRKVESGSFLPDDLYTFEELMSAADTHWPRAHHKNKRFIWMTEEKKLVLPPGTQLVLTPTLAMPLIRYPPHGMDANLTISTPFTVGFDAMGLTDNQNPIGLMPFLMPGIPGGIGRKKRNIQEPSIKAHEIHGGERVILYRAVEDTLFKFGIDGKACLLRAICEMHESPLMGYGFFGEILQLFLTASNSPYVNQMEEYVSAEMAGKTAGECWQYYKDCPRSLFTTKSRYSKDANNKNDNELSISNWIKNQPPLM